MRDVRDICAVHTGRWWMRQTMHQMRDREREVARSQKCSRVLCLSLFTGRRRALVYIIYPERFPKAAIISTPDSARCVCFSHFITCGCVWCRERPTEICAALWITKHTARAAEAQAGRRNKAQKKWTGAWRSLRPRRQRAPALLASNLSLHCYTRDGIPDGQVRTARPRKKGLSRVLL